MSAPHRRRRLMGVAILVLLAVTGVFVTLRVGGWLPLAKTPELPEVPSVNLEGADPAIAKRVMEAHDAVKQSPRSGNLWGRYAMVLHVHGFGDGAQVAYEAASRLEPKSPLWPYLRGELYLEGTVAEALPHFELAARLSPPGSLPRVRLAETLLELGRLDEAEAEYRKVLAVEKNEPLVPLGLGRLAVARRKYREAVPYLESVAENPQVRKTACAVLATVYDRLGDRAAADAARKRLAKLPSDQPRKDDPINLVSQCEVGLRAMLAKAQGLMEQQRASEMLVVVEDTVHRYPDSFEAWDALSIAYEASGNAAGAERAARKSTQLMPKNADALLSLGKLLIGQRRFQDAVQPLEKSLALNPRSGEAHFALGECRKGLGDLAAAAESYRETLRHLPDHAAARQRLEEMQLSP
jgi:protein O-GlcNAc transferase